jgi:hypothetical protein
MTKKNNWLGMLMLLAVFALVAVGCNDQIVEFRLVENGEETAPESGDDDNGDEETVPESGGEETVPGGDGDNSGENYDDAKAFLRQFVEAWRECEENADTDTGDHWIRPFCYGENVVYRLSEIAVLTHNRDNGFPGDEVYEYWKMGEPIAAVQKDGLQAVAVADADLPEEGAGLDEFRYGGWFEGMPKYGIPPSWSTEYIYTAIPGSGCRIDIPPFEHEGETYTVSFYLIKAEGEIIEVDGEDGEKVDRDWKVYWYDGPVEIVEPVELY